VVVVKGGVEVNRKEKEVSCRVEEGSRLEMEMMGKAD
jgi:hypothetical protein